MAILQFRGVGISAMAAAVPSKVIRNYEYTEHFPADEVHEIVDKTGVVERRFAGKGTCASDLCFHAAEKLFSDNNIDRSSVDLLVFISQTPDYRMPATSVILQHRLGLPQTTIAFDMVLSCSAFVFGLAMVYSMMERSNLRQALILDGETRSRVYSAKDRRTAFLFGDAGIAALVRRDEKFGTSIFSLNSDGSREDLIKMEAGGYRNPSTPETLQEKVVDEYGNIRSDEHGMLNGPDVFNFVNREVPKDFKVLLEFAGRSLDEFDYYVLHQANSFMNSHVAKKLKLDPDKTPTTISKYGNTSSVSVPLTIVSELRGKLSGKKELILCAFGAGLSWGTAIVPFVDCNISDIVEV